MKTHAQRQRQGMWAASHRKGAKPTLPQIGGIPQYPASPNNAWAAFLRSRFARKAALKHERRKNMRADWPKLLAPGVHWREANVPVEREARLALMNMGEKKISTVGLVELLWPDAECRGMEQVVVRQRIFMILAKLAVRDLADCASRGATFIRYGKVCKRWQWGAPQPEFNDEYQVGEVCPHCGGAL